MPPEKPRTMWSARSVSLKRVQQFGGARFALAGGLAEVGAVEQQDFAGGEGEIEIGPLRDHADQALGRDLLLPHVVLADEGAAGGRADARGEDADGSGFAGAVGAEQAEDLARADFERDAVQGDHLEFLARALGKAGFAGGEHRPAAGGGGRGRVVDFAQVIDFDADGHGRFGSSSGGGQPVHTL